MSKQIKLDRAFQFKDKELGKNVALKCYGVFAYAVVDEGLFGEKEDSDGADIIMLNATVAFLRTYTSEKFDSTEQLLKEFPEKQAEFVEFAREQALEKGFQYTEFQMEQIGFDEVFREMYEVMKKQKLIEEMAKNAGMMPNAGGNMPKTEAPKTATEASKAEALKPTVEAQEQSVLAEGESVIKKIFGFFMK